MAEPARRSPALEDSELDDPFRFGWRLARVRLPGGESEVREIPLTVEDLLDPQVGDHVVQNSWHIEFVHELLDMMLRRYESSPDVLVTSDHKVIWGIRGLPGPAPDLMVIPGVRDKGKRRASFHCRKEGARPCLVAEVVSHDPEVRKNDYQHKVRIYERGGVREYLILDPHPSRLDTEEDRWLLTGFRLDGSGRYQPIQPDAEGRLLSETTGLWFGTSPDGRRMILTDAETGERLRTSRELQAEFQRATEARCVVELEIARLKEELVRLKGGL
jgi:Uma2 family endonuclease